jgi:3-hydroxyisobutyrate dehydrogenase
VWNRTLSGARDLAASLPDGAVAVADTAEVAVRGRDVVLSVLADGDATRAVLLAPTVLAALTPGAVVCDHGTSGVAAAHDLDAALRAVGVRFVDAPVSGSVPAVAAGTLLVLAGGDPAAVDTARGVLDAYARLVMPVGSAGSGQAMKLAVNLVVHALNAAIAEALALATDTGIPAPDAYDVFEQSVIAAPFVAYKRTAFLDPGTPVAMSLDLVGKDLALITGLAAETGTPVPVTRAAMAAVAAARAAGFGPQDMAALTRYLSGLAGSPDEADCPA